MSSCCSNTESYDVAIVGSGSAAFAAALRADELGQRVVMVEGGTIGGTCVNVGCVPSKALIAVANRLHHARHPNFAGVEGRALSFDALASARERSDLVTTLRKAKYEDVLERLDGVDLLRGWATFAPDGTLTVNGQAVKAGKVILAVGGAPRIPEGVGLEGLPLWTSTDAVAASEVPPRLIVWGGGYVGIEIAQAYARMGSKVSVIARTRLLSSEQKAISAGLTAALESEGLEVFNGAEVSAVTHDDGVFSVVGSFGERRAERLLVAAGRVPNVARLGLEHVGVQVGPRGTIKVDSRLQTTHPDIFAAGDCASVPAFVYVAAYTGKLAASNALNGPERGDLEVVPRVVFSDPQVAGVGLDETQARERGFDAYVSIVPMSEVPRAIVEQRTEGFVQLVADRTSRRLLGAHILAPHAGEIILPAALALRAHMTIDDLAGTLHPYLTWGESLRLAALGFDKDVSQLSCCAA